MQSGPSTSRVVSSRSDCRWHHSSRSQFQRCGRLVLLRFARVSHRQCACGAATKKPAHVPVLSWIDCSLDWRDKAQGSHGRAKRASGVRLSASDRTKASSRRATLSRPSGLTLPARFLAPTRIERSYPRAHITLMAATETRRGITR